MYNTTLFTAHDVQLPSLAPRPIGLMAFFGMLRSRRALANLDADQLADIGISREMAQLEAARPFWDIPSLWRS